MDAQGRYAFIELSYVQSAWDGILVGPIPSIVAWILTHVFPARLCVLRPSADIACEKREMDVMPRFSGCLGSTRVLIWLFYVQGAADGILVGLSPRPCL